MFNMSGSELILIAIVAILLIPAEKLPEVATSLGRWISQLSRNFHEIKSGIETSLKPEPLKKIKNEITNAVNLKENSKKNESDT